MEGNSNLSIGDKITFKPIFGLMDGVIRMEIHTGIGKIWLVDTDVCTWLVHEAPRNGYSFGRYVSTAIEHHIERAFREEKRKLIADCLKNGCFNVAHRVDND